MNRGNEFYFECTNFAETIYCSDLIKAAKLSEYTFETLEHDDI